MKLNCFFYLFFVLVLLSSCSTLKNKSVKSNEADNKQFVFQTEHLKRYEFPTHINDIVVDRSQSATSEVFMVIVESGKRVHHHQHNDTEQVFYIIEGAGTLFIGKNNTEFAFKPGDVIRIPPSTLHSVYANMNANIKYLCVDCFTTKPLESSWDDHVKAVCKEKGYNYNDVIK